MFRRKITGRAVDCLKWQETERGGRKIEQKCGPSRGRTKTGGTGGGERRERQRRRDRRCSSRRKTGSDLITALLRPSLFLLIVSLLPA